MTGERTGLPDHDPNISQPVGEVHDTVVTDHLNLVHQAKHKFFDFAHKHRTFVGALEVLAGSAAAAIAADWAVHKYRRQGVHPSEILDMVTREDLAEGETQSKKKPKAPVYDKSKKIIH